MHHSDVEGEGVVAGKTSPYIASDSVEYVVIESIVKNTVEEQPIATALVMEKKL